MHMPMLLCLGIEDLWHMAFLYLSVSQSGWLDVTKNFLISSSIT
jgi:hypothetical protein